MNFRCMLISVCVLFISAALLFSEDTGKTDDPAFEDIDSLFSQAADIPAPQQNTEPSVSKVSEALSEIVTFPLKFSGSLAAQLGAAYWPKTETHTGYYDFENHLKFTARPENNITVTADLKTSLDNAFTLEVYQMYFDYVLRNHVFITGGKKKIKWGNTHIFTDEANTLIDSVSCMSTIFSIPLGSANLTGIALYGLNNVDVSKEYDTSDTDDDETKAEVAGGTISYAAAFDFIMGMTSVSLFCRKWPTSSKTPNPDPLFGLELKRTVFGFDVYGHGTVDTNPHRTIKAEDVQQYRLIGGFYRVWDNPPLGINVEYLFYKNRTADTKVQKLGIKAGLAHLFNDNITLALACMHNFTTRTGYVTPGFVITHAFPGASLQTGFKFEYGANADDPAKPWLNISMGTKLVLKVTY